jgi:hypothetical protein
MGDMSMRSECSVVKFSQIGDAMEVDEKERSRSDERKSSISI